MTEVALLPNPGEPLSVLFMNTLWATGTAAMTCSTTAAA
jgi:hypothetical protein